MSDLVLDVQIFHLHARPLVTTQKLQARGNAGLVREAANVDDTSELLPAKMGMELLDDRLQGDALEVVVGTQFGLVARHTSSSHVSDARWATFPRSGLPILQYTWASLGFEASGCVREERRSNMGEPKLKVMRVLWAALLGQPLMLLVVGYLVISTREETLTPEPILLPVLGVVALGAAAASVVLPSTLIRPALLALKLPTTDAPAVGPSRGRRHARRFEDAAVARTRLLTTAQTFFIIGMALAESVGLMGFVLWFLGFPFAYVAPMFVVTLALMLSKFPRLSLFEAELEKVYDADLA